MNEDDRLEEGGVIADDDGSVGEGEGEYETGEEDEGEQEDGGAV